MLDTQLNLNNLKQPAPTIIQGNSAPTQQTYNYPKVGVLSIPTISSTPIQDTLTLKKQENPRTAYKLTEEFKKYSKGVKFQTISSLIILACGIIALLSGKKKPVKP